MYYLYAVHGILPGDYYRRSQGERDLIWAFASYEANQRQGPKGAKPKAVRIKSQPRRKK